MSLSRFSKLYSIMRPVSFSTAVTPLLILVCVSGLSSLQLKHHRRSCVILLKVLTILVVFACRGSTLVSLVAKFSKVLSHDIESLYLASYTLGEVFIVALLGCCFQKSFGTFILEFESYQREHGRSDACYRSVLVVGILALIVAVVNIGAAVYYVFATGITAYCHHGYGMLSDTFGDVMCHPALFGASLFFMIQIYSSAFFLYLGVWRLLKIEADDIVKNLTTQEKKTLRERPEMIEDSRLRHADLCHVIATANRFLRHIVAAFYGAGVICVLLSIYGFISNSLGLHDLLMGSMFVGFVVYLVVITLTGVALNLKMHEPADFLYRLDVQRMTGKGSEVVSMFLYRVHGTPIGFNVYSLFTVDTSTIMMICGFILTYALVIVQFHPGAPVQLSPSSSTDPSLPMTSGYTEHMNYVNTTQL
ncbi:hypothetical protein V1264_015182 [Littorina saxatilis]|uniref:Gustatory receptor n=1 Tax=Littorina saxatilis TaxID=31220 RepID=A0AAN9BJ49_9CAEN